FFAVLAHGLGDDALQFDRRAVRERGEGARVAFEHLRHHVYRRGAVERRAPRDHFVKHHAQAEDVGARVHPPAARLFGRHISRRAHDRPRIGDEWGGGGWAWGVFPTSHSPLPLQSISPIRNRAL